MSDEEQAKRCRDGKAAEAWALAFLGSLGVRCWFGEEEMDEDGMVIDRDIIVDGVGVIDVKASKMLVASIPVAQRKHSARYAAYLFAGQHDSAYEPAGWMETDVFWATAAILSRGDQILETRFTAQYDQGVLPYSRLRDIGSFPGLPR